MNKLSEISKIKLEIRRLQNQTKADSQVLDRIVRRHLAVEGVLQRTHKDVPMQKILAHIASGYRKQNRTWNKYYY